MEAYSYELFWWVVISFIVAFILSFGIGANDVANSFGTSVGARVLSLRTACILATIFEIMGSVLLGYKVSDTLRRSLIDVNLYENLEKKLILGYLSSLGGSGAWLLIATFLHFPISATHSIVGATIGFSLMAKGFSGLQWSTLIRIVASWFISPICSGMVSVIVYLLIRTFILNSPNPMKNGLRSLPIFYGITIGINVYSVLEGVTRVLQIHDLSLPTALFISIFFGVSIATVVYKFMVPRQRLKLNCLLSKTKANVEDNSSQDTKAENNGTVTTHPPADTNGEDLHILEEYDEADKTKMNKTETENEHSEKINKKQETAEKERINDHSDARAVPLMNIDAILAKDKHRGTKKPELFELGDSESCGTLPLMRTPIETIFIFLHILTAIFSAFAHGGNDVSNGIGPLVAIWLIYSSGSAHQSSDTPFYILLYGGIGISVGLCIWGRNVIKTVGEDLTQITPSTGFSIELGSSMTVLLASKLGVPISTTHCKVGSVVFVGWSSSTARGVNWSLFKNIIFAWVVTLPVSAILSAGLMLFFCSYS